MAHQLAGLAGILQNIQIPPGVFPTMIDLPPPPKLEGALAPNDLLSRARKHAFNRVLGPESMVVFKGHVYTGQADGWLVEISPFGSKRRLARFPSINCHRMGTRGRRAICGRPMGIRLDGQGFLIVADAVHGIFKVNPKSGRFKQLVNPRIHRPNNRPLGYINDLTVSKDGLIFFTSSSSKWPLPRQDSILLEGDHSGRVLFYNPRELRWTEQVREVLTNLSFPNGLQLSANDMYLLVGEGTYSRIHRIWLGPNPPPTGRLETFADNLPGVVDNIRLSPRGTYWVGFSQTRHRTLPSVLDAFGQKPRVRGALITLRNNRMAFAKPRYGMVVELDEKGKVIRSLQDPQGKVYSSVSEVQEENGVLFFASPHKTFIGFMKLPPAPADTTTPDPPGTGSPGTGSPGSGTGSGAGSGAGAGTGAGSGTPGAGSGTGSGTPGAGSGTGSGTPGSGGGLGPPLGPGVNFPFSRNPKVVAFLRKIRYNTMRMSAQRIRQVVMALIKHLILAKRQAIILTRMADARERDLRRIKETLRQLQQQQQQLQQSRTTPRDSGGSRSTTTAAPVATDTSSRGHQQSTATSGPAGTTPTMSSGVPTTTPKMDVTTYSATTATAQSTGSSARSDNSATSTTSASTDSVTTASSTTSSGGDTTTPGSAQSETTTSASDTSTSTEATVEESITTATTAATTTAAATTITAAAATATTAAAATTTATTAAAAATTAAADDSMTSEAVETTTTLTEVTEAETTATTESATTTTPAATETNET